MPNGTGSGRRINWDDGETEKKRKNCSRQNGLGIKLETETASGEPPEWMPMPRREPALRPPPSLAADGARYRGCPPFQACPPAEWPPPPPCCASAGARRHIAATQIRIMRVGRTRKAIRLAIAFPIPRESISSLLLFACPVAATLRSTPTGKSAWGGTRQQAWR